MIDRSRRLEIRLLGQLDVLVDGRPVDVPGRRPRALLAVLALAAGEPVPVESLYERVWGHDLPGDVRANLYTCVRRLRRALGESAIHNEAGRYSLRVDPEDVDAVRFTRLLDGARAVGADQEPLLRQALELWRGAPFGDEQLSEWLTANESRRLTERWLAAVQQRVDLDLAAGRHDGLAEELEQLTAAYPQREPLCGARPRCTTTSLSPTSGSLSTRLQRSRRVWRWSSTGGWAHRVIGRGRWTRSARS